MGVWSSPRIFLMGRTPCTPRTVRRCCVCLSCISARLHRTAQAAGGGQPRSNPFFGRGWRTIPACDPGGKVGVLVPSSAVIRHGVCALTQYTEVFHPIQASARAHAPNSHQVITRGARKEMEKKQRGSKSVMSIYLSPTEPPPESSSSQFATATYDERPFGPLMCGRARASTPHRACHFLPKNAESPRQSRLHRLPVREHTPACHRGPFCTNKTLTHWLETCILGHCTHNNVPKNGNTL
ncbi:hypothetical protein EDB83DRAFT_2358376 [Lactarius deliciosus]|nr:hypothetical protein EDB83DRAFT_2358376 [Lactarius deliciosus]